MPLVTPRITRLATLYAPTLKEDPVEAEIASHKLLLRAAMMRRVAPGIFSFLPLGFAVLRKIEQIVREEMEAIGSQELLMPILQPAELWHESGRWDVYGPELMRLTDRHERSFALGPTHEELITSLVRNELRSYKELPKALFHMHWKYRDEIRPRFGLLRGREFLMKDSYSFHSTQESLQEHYDAEARAYGRICDRLGLKWRAVDADSGQIGGNVSSEFMALAEAGEAGILYCDAPGCHYAANTEVAPATPKPLSYESPLKKIPTPGVATITDLATFLDIPEAATVKALAGKGEDGVVTVLFIPGDRELGDIKATYAVPGFELMTDEEMLAAGLHKGFMGPVGLPAGTRIVADASLQTVPAWLVGANEDDHHLAGATPGRDFEVAIWADLTTAVAGDACPHCGAPLIAARGIEVGQVFQLGTKYSVSMNATYMDENGSDKPFIMGCYGWGVTRSLAAVVEQYNDENGILWPLSVAPAEVCIMPLITGDELVQPAAERLAQELVAAGIEVALDDRDERAGIKFNDADLIGWPYQLIVGKRGLEAGKVELKVRATNEKSELPLDSAAQQLATLIQEERTKYL